jgi:hypothetical protein
LKKARVQLAAIRLLPGLGQFLNSGHIPRILLARRPSISLKDHIITSRKKERKAEMKAKQFLFVAVVVAVLGTMIAFPVMAEDETPMWVNRVRLAYNGRSSHSSDRVVGMAHVRDANMSAVAGVLVAATWTKPDGTTLETTAVTDFQGIATFQVWAGGGEYQLCVTDLTLDGWLYDPDANVESCGMLVIQWPFNPPG